VEDDITVATFINKLDIDDQEGHGIVNIFEQDENDGWTWTGAYSTTPTAGLPPKPQTAGGGNTEESDGDGGDDGNGGGGNDDTGNTEGGTTPGEDSPGEETVK
jgi:hypothetical protein